MIKYCPGGDEVSTKYINTISRDPACWDFNGGNWNGNFEHRAENKMIRSRWMRWAEHVACMGKLKNAYNILVRKS